jgi:tRNA/tmRNA/rRNA uracil-C5-methylase (TrmA/RlmC/RlmD family)
MVEVTEDRGGSFCRGDAIEVIWPSPARVEPPCPLAVPGGCGGCDWQHVSAAEQRALKAFVVAEQLRRLAGVERPVVVEELAGGLLRWRTRVRLAVDGNGRAGFHAHRSHRIVPVDDCPISAPGTVDAIAEHRWTPGVELDVTLDAQGHTHVSEYRPAAGRRRGQPRAGVRRLLGSGVAVERAAKRQWRLATEGFWQVHPDAADVLAEVVAEWTALPVGACGWDLYCGVGLFAAVIAGQVGPGGTVLAVESVRTAVADAVANLADFPQVQVHAGRVDRVLASEDLPVPDAVVLDPPRKGAGAAVVDAIARRRPARVVYVACDPAALARDVAWFAGHGYRLAALRAFDAFPMTHHVECVALLDLP